MDVLRTVVSMSGLVFVLALLVNVVAVPAVAWGTRCSVHGGWVRGLLVTVL